MCTSPNLSQLTCIMNKARSENCMIGLYKLAFVFLNVSNEMSYLMSRIMKLLGAPNHYQVISE